MNKSTVGEFQAEERALTNSEIRNNSVCLTYSKQANVARAKVLEWTGSRPCKPLKEFDF